MSDGRAGGAGLSQGNGSLAIPRPSDFFIERVPVDHHFGDRLERWKKLRAEGWDLEVIIERKDASTVVALGVRRA